MQDYRAPGWLVGGHAQTIWPALFSRRFSDTPPRLRRERWPTPDGDFVDVDWTDDAPGSPGTATTPPEGASPALGRPGARLDDAPGSPGTAPAPPGGASPALGRPGARLDDGTAQPLLVLFHGLEGSSSSHYAQAFAHVAGVQGWRFVLPHFRGCSGEINLAPRAYHSGDFEEIGWMLARIRAAHPGPIVAVGVSLGGNALMRWAEEAGDAARETVRAVAAISAPLDLAAGASAIGRGFNRQVYTRMFLNTMKPKALDKLAQHPGLFDRTRLLAARDLYAFDDIFTAPLHGFRSADDYYARASAKSQLRRIRVPALVLNARNDPFVPAASLPQSHEVGDCVTLWQPRHGGHVGFPGGRWPAHVLTLPEQVMRWIGPRI